MSEKQASSEIAQSREDEKFAADFVDVFGGFPQDLAISLLARRQHEIRQAAERDTRERCAQIAEGIAGTEPDGVFEAGYDCGARMAAERIRGKE